MKTEYHRIHRKTGEEDLLIKFLLECHRYAHLVSVFLPCNTLKRSLFFYYLTKPCLILSYFSYSCAENGEVSFFFHFLNYDLIYLLSSFLRLAWTLSSPFFQSDCLFKQDTFMPWTGFLCYSFFLDYCPCWKRFIATSGSSSISSLQNTHLNSNKC